MDFTLRLKLFKLLRRNLLKRKSLLLLNVVRGEGVTVGEDAKKREGEILPRGA